MTYVHGPLFEYATYGFYEPNMVWFELLCQICMHVAQYVTQRPHMHA
eukprot:COSAG05_NODE_2562_length_2898_cov_3.997856_3_plen_47_part_00